MSSTVKLNGVPSGKRIVNDWWNGSKSGVDVGVSVEASMMSV